MSLKTTWGRYVVHDRHPDTSFVIDVRSCMKGLAGLVDKGSTYIWEMKILIYYACKVGSPSYDGWEHHGSVLTLIFFLPPLYLLENMLENWLCVSVEEY